jgi:hypothetical protein
MLASHLEVGGGMDLTQMRRDMPSALSETLDDVLEHAENITFEDEDKACEAAVRCALRLRDLRLRRESENLVFLQQDAHTSGDAEAVRQWSLRVAELAAEMYSLEKARAANSTLRFGSSVQA